jgi:hypothetical protein
VRKKHLFTIGERVRLKIVAPSGGVGPGTVVSVSGSGVSVQLDCNAPGEPTLCSPHELARLLKERPVPLVVRRPLDWYEQRGGAIPEHKLTWKGRQLLELMRQFLGECPRVAVDRSEVLYYWIGRHPEGTALVLADYLRDHKIEPSAVGEGRLFFRG